MISEAGQITILIVEDDEGAAELERRAIVRAGMSVHVACCIKDALSAMSEHIFHAILLDYNLPDGDPWQIVDAADAKKPRTPVIMVTAQGNERVAAEALRRGVADYLKKSGSFWD
ncbi:MAG TPA: response regulator, partial [Burkholderiaceae bacterium]|nr:response regulator [Burkholderiaceae bacterium]